MFINFIVSTILFFIGSLGVFLSRKNLILCIMSLELMLLAINMNFVFFSIYTDTIFGQLSTFFILVVGASESAIGLALIIVYYKGYRYYY
jgi:NADH-quinone oxidoreductase subunit K